MEYITIERGIILFLILLLISSRKKVIKRRNFNQLILDDFNKNIYAFTSFLDDFKNNHSHAKEYLIKRNYDLSIIYENYCKHCSNCKGCYEKNKGVTYNYLCNILKHGQDINFKNQDSEVITLIKLCPFNSEIISTAGMLKQRYNEKASDYLLGTQLDAISSLLKNYAIDKNTSYNTFVEKLTKTLEKIKNNNSLVHFNINSYEDDNFSIDMYFNHISESKAKKITKMFSNSIKKELSYSIESVEDYKRVIITLKQRFFLTYSASSFAKDGNLVSGDNYLLKNNNINSKFILAISDGMGKGFNAYEESRNLLNIVDNINSTNIDSGAFFNILNTFYRLKDFNDIYSTLDYAEISKISGKMSIYKLGSASSYVLKNNGELITFNNTNLPLGVDYIIYQTDYNLEDGDILFLLSDGLTDLIDEDEFHNIALASSNQPPQRIISTLMEHYSNDFINKDDISVICVKIKGIA